MELLRQAAGHLHRHRGRGGGGGGGGERGLGPRGHGGGGGVVRGEEQEVPVTELNLRHLKLGSTLRDSVNSG